MAVAPSGNRQVREKGYGFACIDFDRQAILFYARRAEQEQR